MLNKLNKSKPKRKPVASSESITLPTGYAFQKQGAVYYAVAYVNGIDATLGWHPLTSSKEPVPDMSEDPADLIQTILAHQRGKQEQARIARRSAVQGNLL